jgi:hypothetical protein
MGLKTAWSAGLVLIAASVACAQAPGVAGPGAQVLFSSPGPDPYQSAATGEIVREIDDPHTGDRWLLMHNDQVPGGPGRLVLIAAPRKAIRGTSLQAAGEADEAQILPVIRAGDRLIVEEHTARVDAVLEARAMNPAAPGSVLNVRLTIGGNVVRAVALGPGRATLQPEAGVRP